MDEKIFLIIYSSWHNLSLNFFFSVVSALGSYGFIWLLFSFFLKKKAKFILAFCFLTFGLFALQNYFARLRPYEMLENVRYLGFIDPGGYSFPSYHSAVAFFSAFIFTKKFKKIYFYLLAILIAFSRVYLGAHFPSDIIVGMLIGLSYAFFLDKKFNFV